MSAQLSQHVVTRLLIAETSENKAHQLDSLLRDAGIATKPLITDDLAQIAQILADGEIDIALLSDRVAGLARALPRMRENAPLTPLIFLKSVADDADGAAQVTTADALSLGATDLIPADEFERISLVVKRERQHVCQREHFTEVRRALKEAEQRCQLLLQGSQVAIAYVHEGMHIHANEGYLELFGFTDPDDMMCVSLIDLLDDASSEQLKLRLKSLRNGADDALLEFASRESEGKTVQGTMTLTSSQYEGRECLQITVRSQRASETANGDQSEGGDDTELGLRKFVESAEALFASNSEERFVFFVCLDKFTIAQRTHGLVGGELIAQKFWRHFREVASEFPTVRLASDQFALALCAASHDEAINPADVLRKSLAELMFEVQEKTVRPTATFAGGYLNEADSVGAILDQTHEDLLDAAASGTTNEVLLPQRAPTEGADFDEAKVILRQITEAIEKRMFVLLFQPIISLRGDADEHYEVFLRMLDPDGEQIQPGRFLQTAIDNNVAGKIDPWVILQSIKMLSVRRAKGHATRLPVNLTCNSVNDPEFLPWLTVAIKAARLPSDAVIFQITEKDATTYLRQSREFIEGLSAMHCRAALSRFGLVDDPFESLSHLPVDIVKLDGAQVLAIETEVGAKSVVDQITKLQGLGKLTVVPMVENANVLSTLWQAGANYIQGHYLQEPTTEMDYDFSTEE